MVRITTVLAVVSCNFVMEAAASPATVAKILAQRKVSPQTYSVTGVVTLAGETLSNFICYGLSYGLAVGYSNYLRNGVECFVDPAPNDGSGTLFHATCQVENDPTGAIEAILETAKQNCESEGGEFDQNMG